MGTIHYCKRPMIKENLRNLQQQIKAAAINAGRDADDVKLVAVSKRFPASSICEAHSAGQILFGENYIQEASEKKPQIPPEVKLHFIGHLQSNKAKIAAEIFDMIETIDSMKLAKSLDKHLKVLGRTLRVLVQVNIADDQKKFGIEGQSTSNFVEQLQQYDNLNVCGLMTMPPIVSDPELSRPHFRALRELAEDIGKKGFFTPGSKTELSMGMSNDFAVAIEEGATIIRVGTAIFGNRPLA